MQKETVTLFGLACENVSSGFVKASFQRGGEKPENKRCEETNLQKECMATWKKFEGITESFMSQLCNFPASELFVL